MFSAIKLAQDEHPAASVYLTPERLLQSLRSILARPDGTVGEPIEDADALIQRQEPDGAWKPEALEACGCLNKTALTSFLIACGADRFHPQVRPDLEVGFATLLGFLHLLTTGGFGRANCKLRSLRFRLSDAAYEAAERAFNWLMRFGQAYPEMPTRLGLAPAVDVLCGALLELLMAAKPDQSKEEEEEAAGC